MNLTAKRFFLVIVGLCFVAGMSASAALTAEAATDTAKSGLFVDPAWLKANLSKVVIVDARPEKAFLGGHIPNAVSAPWQTFANMQGKPGDPGWGVLLPKDQLAAKIGALGIDGRTPVVVYAEPPGWGEDGRFAWMVRMAGIPDVKILDGGYAAWKKAGGDTRTDKPPASNHNFAISSLEGGLTATTGWIQAHMALMMRMAGFAKARNYDASFYEWAGMKQLPLE